MIFDKPISGGAIFDGRIFLGESFDGTCQDIGQALRSMDALGIDMALACPFKPLSYNLDEANTRLATTIKAYADRLLGAARVDPWQPDAADTLRRGFEALGLRALFLHPWEEHFRADLERLDPLMEIASAFQYPVMVMSGYPWVSEALQVRKLALRWPNVPVIMTNGGQINISGLGQADATLAMRAAPNLYIDTAGIYRQDFIEETAQEFGAQRILFGSGSPYFDQRYEIKRVQFAKLPKQDRQAIQGGNAIRLFDLKV
jgi:predicted TIM-barrel fold metal-dependent hydrolase